MPTVDRDGDVHFHPSGESGFANDKIHVEARDRSLTVGGTIYRNREDFRKDTHAEKDSRGNYTLHPDEHTSVHVEFERDHRLSRITVRRREGGREGPGEEYTFHKGGTGLERRHVLPPHRGRRDPGHADGSHRAGPGRGVGRGEHGGEGRFRFPHNFPFMLRLLKGPLGGLLRALLSDTGPHGLGARFRELADAIRRHRGEWGRDRERFEEFREAMRFFRANFPAYREALRNEFRPYEIGLLEQLAEMYAFLEG
jgi:hypothetical protein